MWDIRARRKTSLTGKEWTTIIKHYVELKNEMED